MQEKCKGCGHHSKFAWCYTCRTALRLSIFDHYDVEIPPLVREDLRRRRKAWDMKNMPDSEKEFVSNREVREGTKKHEIRIPSPRQYGDFLHDGGSIFITPQYAKALKKSLKNI